MKIISFIDEHILIRHILKHLNLWRERVPKDLPPPEDAIVETSLCKAIPILFISGNIEFLESMEEIRILDPRMDHISKPCENIVFADAVNLWLGQTR